MDHTVLQLIDRQYVARTHLFHNAAYHLQSIYIDYQLFATKSGHLFFPPSVVSLNLNAYMLDLPLKVSPRNTVSINVLQNSISYMDHTVLQLIDRQYVARTHLFHNAAYHLQSIYIDYQLFATESGHQFSPPSVVSLNLNAYMLDLPLKVGPRNTVSINVLQNSMSYMGHTVLQLIDRQHVARTHLFHNAAYHLQYIFIDCQPIATEGGRYVQESHSIQFCRPE